MLLPTQPRVDLVYFDAGGGHRSAALALRSVIASQGRHWEVRLVNLQEVLDSLDIFRKITGRRLQDVYNLALARGWTLGSTYMLPAMHAIIRLYHGAQVKLLAQFWTETQPDLVVSLVPNFNRALYQSLKRATPAVPFATVLTDMADYPPHFWMEKQPGQYIVCGTPYAREQALRIGHPAQRTFLTSGMILRPEFYAEVNSTRDATLSQLGLDPAVPTGLVLFGGEGSSVMTEIAQKLGNTKLSLQLILICGRNKRLQSKLSKLKTSNRTAVLGFSNEIPQLMSTADFFIGKPGPGSVAEAIHKELPVIVEKNAWTLPQERYNASWLHEQGLGIVLPSFRSIETAVARLFEGGTMQTMKDRTKNFNNRAVFEVPDLLDRILTEHNLQANCKS